MTQSAAAGEHSCGAVVFTRRDGILLYVLIRSRRGMYGFPKGHMETGETERETALREIYEEVHLRPDLIDGFVDGEDYPVRSRPEVIKHVTYFLAEYHDQVISIQREELTGAALVPYASALKLLRNPVKEQILARAHRFLRERTQG